MSSESAVRCRGCREFMKASETVAPPDAGEGVTGPVIEVYVCETESCQLRAAILFEPQGGLTDEQRSFVEREVGRRGAFFPSDLTGGFSGKYGRG